MDPHADRDRRFLDLVTARRLVDPEAVARVARHRERLLGLGRPVPPLPQMLVVAGALDPQVAVDVVRELRGRSEAPTERDMVPPAVPAPADAVRRSSGRLARGVTAIGHYILGDELGRGGMGVVYRARDGRLDREVALKTVSGVPDEETRRRFVNEGRALARLRHPGIVTVFEVSELDGFLFMALELVEGETLAARLDRDGPLSPRRAATAVRELALAVQAAHDGGVIHRDLKPANVLIDAQARLRLTDFGLARDDSASLITATGDVLGTPAYMAPEQASGLGEQIGPATDVYGLGAVLYQVLTGEPPFKGASPVDVLRRVIDDDPSPPSAARDRLGLSPVPPQLDAICLRALEKTPAARYPSAEALAEDLRRFLDGESVLARPLGWIGRAVRRAGHGKLTAALAGVGLAFALGAGGAALFSRERADRLAVGEVVRREEAARRAAAVAEARRAAEKTIERFEAARDGDGPEREEDVVLAGMEALAAAERLRALGDDAGARGLAFRAAMGLGEAAEAAGERLIARRAFDVATRLGVDDARASAALEGVLAAPRVAVEAVVSPPSVEAGLDAQANITSTLASALPPDAYARLTALIRARNVPAIIAELDRAIERWPERARLYAARGAFRRAGGDPRGACDDLERAVDLAPEDATIRQDLVGMRLAVGDLAGATVAAQAAIDLAPKDARSWLVLGNARAAAREFEAAIEAYSRMMTLDPVSVRVLAYTGRALCRRNLGDVSGALEDLGRAVEVGGDDEKPIVLRARLRSESGDVDGALQDFGRAIEQGSVDPSVHEARGMLLLNLGRRSEALVDLTRAIELAPRRTSALAARTLLRRQIGDFQGAIQDVTGLIGLRPADPALWGDLGDLHLKVGELDRAADAYSRSIDMGPRNPFAWYGRATAHERRGDLERAAADHERFLELAPPGALEQRAHARDVIRQVRGDD